MYKYFMACTNEFGFRNVLGHFLHLKKNYRTFGTGLAQN